MKFVLLHANLPRLDRRMCMGWTMGWQEMERLRRIPLLYGAMYYQRLGRRIVAHLRKTRVPIEVFESLTELWYGPFSRSNTSYRSALPVSAVTLTCGSQYGVHGICRCPTLRGRAINHIHQSIDAGSATGLQVKERPFCNLLHRSPWYSSLFRAYSYEYTT